MSGIDHILAIWVQVLLVMSFLLSDMNLVARKRNTTEQSGSTSWKDAAATARAKGRACVPRAEHGQRQVAMAASRDAPAAGEAVAFVTL